MVERERSPITVRHVVTSRETQQATEDELSSSALNKYIYKKSNLGGAVSRFTGP